MATPPPTLSTPTTNLTPSISRLGLTSTSQNPLACLSTLPPELKALIVEFVFDLDTLEAGDDDDEEVEEVDEEEEEDGKKTKWIELGNGVQGRPTPIREKDADGMSVESGWSAVDHEHEEWGTKRLPTLEVLSRVNRDFAELAFPFLWRNVNLAAMSNHDLLYFLLIIIPRHAPHITFLEGLKPSFSLTFRSEVPPYISDSLKMPVQIAFENEEEEDDPNGMISLLQRQEKLERELKEGKYDGRLDTVFFGGGQELREWPSLASGDAGDLDWVESSGLMTEEGVRDLDRKREEYGLQRTQILATILDQKTLPNLSIIHFDLEGDDERLEQHLEPLLPPLSTRGTKIVEIGLESVEGQWSETDDEGVPNFPLSESWLATFVRLFPNLLKLTIDFPPSAPSPTPSRQLLVDTITGLRSLERLSIADAYWVSTSFVEAEWTCPLQLLHLAGADLSLFELYALFEKLGQSLKIVDLDDTPNSDLNKASKKILGKAFPLPKLETLVLSTLLPSAFLDSFAGCPITELEIGDCPNIPYADWEKFLDLHRPTLKEVRVGSDSTLTEGETESMELLCFARGVGFEIVESDESDEEGSEEYWDQDDDEDDEDEGDWSEQDESDDELSYHAQD